MMNCIFCLGESKTSPHDCRFFLAHKEINVAEFARMIGMNPALLRNYINGFKKPSKEREQEIIEHIHKLGEEMIVA